MNVTVLCDRYEIRQPLNKKPGRYTYRAADRHTQESVIVTLLVFGDGLDWHEFDRFTQEANVFKTLSHPAIPPFQEAFEFDLSGVRGLAFVRTYIRGQTLAEHLAAGRIFSEAEATQIAKESLALLNYLHGQNPPIVHRNINPNNILLSARTGHITGKVFITDFSSVQTSIPVDGWTQRFVGIYDYTPPEQLSGYAVPASDLYSLGKTLVHLMTGQRSDHPFTQNVHTLVESAHNTSSDFKCWLRRLLEPRLNKRAKSSRKALQALRCCTQKEWKQLPSLENRFHHNMLLLGLGVVCLFQPVLAIYFFIHYMSLNCAGAVKILCVLYTPFAMIAALVASLFSTGTIMFLILVSSILLGYILTYVSLWVVVLQNFWILVSKMILRIKNHFVY
ncbi:MAG: protein kinase [Cyanobacteria bacterium P01_F01_bin.13]